MEINITQRCRTLLLLILAALFAAGCASKATNVPEASAAAAANSPDIRVCLDDGVQDATLSFNGDYHFQTEEARYGLNNSIDELQVMSQDGNLVIKNSKRFFQLSPPQTLRFIPKNSKSSFIWNKIAYNGELTLHFENDQLLAVNKLPLEDYLAGVVANEIPFTQNEYEEAIIAQAIVSRSYALYRLDHPVNTLYDIHMDKPDQVYKGLENNSSLSNKAVSGTQGVILARLNQPAEIKFHSTSGGVLEVDTPSDSTLGTPPDYSPDSVDGIDNDKDSPFYRWSENRNVDTILNNLQRLFSLDPAMVQRWLENGFLLDISITSRKPSGRIEQATVTIDNRSFTLDTDEKICAAFADESGKPLPSTLFFIKQPPKDTEKFYILGAGAGHGKGMSQWGAAGLALKGYDHRYILGFYYPDLTITKYY